MKYKYIGFPMKDGCHVYGADLGIEILNKHVKIDKIIEIDTDKDDLNNVIASDTRLASYVHKTIDDGYIPVTLGGDHSLAIGTIAGASQSGEIGVIWFDTHPDCNTDKTTTTFNIHGYPLGASMGFGKKELTELYTLNTKVNYQNVVMFGIDDIDEPEKKLIEKYNIKNYPLSTIKEKGIEYCINDAINYLKNKVSKIHLSFDIDVINRNECPGVNVPNKWNNGITKQEALNAFKSFIKDLNITSIDIVEYNPKTDIENKSLNIVLQAIDTLEKTKDSK